ncbi:PKD domain-containing protein [Hymenobacter cellulosivorans]|uniref:PKD domain-containing protein n=1 Tax=Hymenobacter cellulosivorans TaxID=2932249 RepID=A0ABY4F2I2_9BACT|nr:PKD domain-containing protein [Hymenobacter cellulosivorans]UOQ50760.1 PKD domain-containing protein [Hymenobacter cellulosivorans]
MFLSQYYAQFLLLLTFLLLGCKKEPAPLATAGISSSGTILEVNESFWLSNMSTHAAHYEWKLPDGTVSTQRDLAVTFPKPGIYSVELTAYNLDDIPVSTSITLRVGIRAVKEVRVTKMNFTADTGEPWDKADGTGPDVSFLLINGATKADVTSAQLPLVWNMSSISHQIVPARDDKSWRIVFWEESEPPFGLDLCGERKLPLGSTMLTEMRWATAQRPTRTGIEAAV